MATIIYNEESVLLRRALQSTVIWREYNTLAPEWRKFFFKRLESNGVLKDSRGAPICLKPRLQVLSSLNVLWISAEKLNSTVLSFKSSNHIDERVLFEQLQQYGASGRLDRAVNADYACVGLLGIQCMQELLTDIEAGNEPAPSSICAV